MAVARTSSNPHRQIAKNFTPLPASEMKDLSMELSQKYKVSIDRFFATHRDC